MKSKKYKRAATLSIKAPGKMTKRGRRDIATWLRHHAECLMKYGDEYTAGTFRGRFYY